MRKQIPSPKSVPPTPGAAGASQGAAPPPPAEPNRRVHCRKLGRELPGLAAPPFPTPLGARIFAEISQEAWNQWLQHSLLLINEKGLRLSDPAARSAWMQECESFLFGGGAAPPPGWVPPAGTVRFKKGTGG